MMDIGICGASKACRHDRVHPQRYNPTTPDPSDPSFDLLKDGRSLFAFPLFQRGVGNGMVVLLASSSRSHSSADLCALAMMTSLLGRAIETQNLADQLQLTCRALDSELKAAADVQRWLLPSLPPADDIDIASSYRTARYAGGDYYDVGRLADGRLGILIADVSGKGAAAAVLMAVLRSIVHDEVDRAAITSPAALLEYADDRLRSLGLSHRGAFITAFCAILNPISGELVYSCAGHNPPRLRRPHAPRTIISLDEASTFPLGLVDEAHSRTEATAFMTPGDLAVFFTDGITEARSPAGEFFGSQRLDQLLLDLPDPATPREAVDAIAKAVADFAGDAPPADDQTLLVLVGIIRTDPLGARMPSANSATARRLIDGSPSS
jgi:sigma-B regulation protein RsbU (phosphoserine phosphatase)